MVQNLKIIPEYVSKSFIEKSLRNGLKNDKLIVKDVHIEMGTSTGDNYCSDIYRAHINYLKDAESRVVEKTSIIIKAMPFTEVRGPTLTELEVHGKEIEMLTQVLPALSETLGGESFSAKCFYATDDPIQLIAFEDLRLRDFRMADRNIGLDYQHCDLVLKKLARLHAASYVYAKKDVQTLEKYRFGMVKHDIENSDLYVGMFEKSVEALATVSEEWAEFKTITKKLKKIQENFVKRLQKKIYESHKTAAYRILNHGDAWVNNFMFTYIDDKPEEVTFVDYQLSYYTSPGIDLNYFFNTSPTSEVRETKFEPLLKLYHREFADTLKAMKIENIPTIEDLYIEYARCEYYGFMAASSILPILLMCKTHSTESQLDKACDEEAGAKIREAMYHNKIFQSAVKPILLRFENNGVLDELCDIDV